MSKKLTGWKTKGMNRDLSVSAFNPEFAFENRNLRLSTNENNTLMSWVNEKGTKEIEVEITVYRDTATTNMIEGEVIGTAVLNHKLVLFTHSEATPKDRIIVLSKSGSKLRGRELYAGNLKFYTNYPLETLVSYESETVQKVYWTDGKNQPRVVNIVAENNNKWTDTTFDFVRTLQLKEIVRVKKVLGASGMFPAGVIQYAFTYFDKYGQESNIFYTSPLLYTSYQDRGGSPEDVVDNAFQITVHGADQNFDYLRIYSIMRTSLNGTPICKRVQDIALEGLDKDQNGDIHPTFLDTGTVGDTIDPAELLYKGGEAVICQTMEQKDNTLFLGNLKMEREDVGSILNASDINSITPESSSRGIKPTEVSTGSYAYSNQLTSEAVVNPGEESYTVPCGGFKKGETYRLGVQFQHKTGKWSEPLYLTDVPMGNGPVNNGDGTFNLPIFTGYVPQKVSEKLLSKDYLKVRGVCVFPEAQDRTVVCQGVVNPTMYTDTHRGNNDNSALYNFGLGNQSNNSENTAIKDLYAQSSWFFRAKEPQELILNNKAVFPKSDNHLNYTALSQQAGTTTIDWNPKDIRSVEIQGLYALQNQFQIDKAFSTFHSPDVEFDDTLWDMNYSNISYKGVGKVQFTHTLSDIDIQTETPAASSIGSGFVHTSFDADSSYGIVSGFLYDDAIIDELKEEDIDNASKFRPYSKQKSPMKWLVYLWNKSGSLNNDVNRQAGTRTAVLKKKVISNLRYAVTKYEDQTSTVSFNGTPQVFYDDQSTIIKVNGEIYMGNIDTMLIPDKAEGMYYVYNGETVTSEDVITPIASTNYWRTFSSSATEAKGDLQNYRGTEWVKVKSTEEGLIGDDVVDLVLKKDPVRMKYKSTPHIVFSTTSTLDSKDVACLPIAELRRDNVPMRFGGTSSDALKANNWLPCGEPKLLRRDNATSFNWEYGDTYYQRWDCLKTYAFTREDENQVVEIGSFMLETHVNIDGRYDRNRGQSNNLNMSPVNFNLLNKVYSQRDNFFTYKIMDKSFYENQEFPNQLTWTLTKQAGADVDHWTTITLASTMDMDGNKGKVNKLIRLNDQIICFQDSGISQVLYNENVQISSTEGVPIEIANSGKVQGKRYLSNTVGCSNKWSMVQTPAGIYFMDSINKAIYLFNGQLNNLSASLGFDSWSKTHILSSKYRWTPSSYLTFAGYYDKKNQDVLFINDSTALAYSEKLGAFTSFYDYGGTPYFCNLDDVGLWINYDEDDGNKISRIWQHQGGEYCKFFGKNYSYGMILIGNPEPQTDKIFTNLEFRACVDGEGEMVTVTQSQTELSRYQPYLPFDYLETWNEYQKGVSNLKNMRSHTAMLHHTSDRNASLKRKFRIWRCDIPRDNYGVSGDALDVFDDTFDFTFHPEEGARNCHPMDRMRNPWLYIKLRKNAEEDEEKALPRAEIHDLVMTYFS